MYRVFNESRKAAREQATLSVVGDHARAAEIADILGAERTPGGAEIVITVSGSGGKVALSGKGIEDSREISLPSVTEETIKKELVPAVVRALEDDYLVPLGRGYPVFRRVVCEEIVRKNARQNAVIGALPIPGADMPVMTANQSRMVLQIAAVHGEEMSLERARELLGVLAAGFGLRALGRQAAKLVPVVGWAAAGTVAYAGTLAMGQATILYFERGKREPSAGEKSEIMRRARKEAEEFVARMRRR